jgi:hypothetical protein
MEFDGFALVFGRNGERDVQLPSHAVEIPNTKMKGRRNNDFFYLVIPDLASERGWPVQDFLLTCFRNFRILRLSPNDPDALEDYRTPRFDLDNVCGRGPDDQPYLYAHGRLFLLGDALTGAASDPGAKDLPRSALPDLSKKRAIIGDPRNDENVIVSQLQGLFHRFHNKIAGDHPR